MGKKKLARFRELETFNRVFQPTFEEVFQKNYPLKGLWSREVFGNENPLILELGCGKGEYTVGLARNHPGCNFMGLDIKGARMWKGARMAHDEGMQNVAFLRTRIEFIGSFFAPGEVEELWITFPDPQQKKRRKKKRLTGALFLNSYRHFLRDNGTVHLKTDNRLLFEYTLELARYNQLEIECSSGDIYQEGWDNDVVAIQTYYESRFLEEGLPIHYIRFRLPAHREIMELPHDLQ